MESRLWDSCDTSDTCTKARDNCRQQSKQRWRQLTQHLGPREHVWWTASCCSARSRSTPDSCRSTSTHGLCCVNRSRCFSHFQNLLTDQTTTGRTWVRMLAALCSDRACGCHPNPEFLARDLRARTRIADSLKQLVANNRKHPCRRRKLVLNIWFYLKRTTENRKSDRLGIENNFYLHSCLNVKYSVKCRHSWLPRNKNNVVG